MRQPALILIADDNEANVDILATRLGAQGYQLITARDGEAALARARADLPDLVLLDIMMPKIDGLEVCRRLKNDKALPLIPIILVTAKADSKDVVAGLDVGADEYLTKPIDQAALVARVRSILRIKALHDTAQEQAKRLAAQAEQLEQWNRSLERRVAEQVAELDRVSRLRRFLPRQIAELVVSSGQEALLESHRREVSVMFCDLRGFTAFAEVAEPEEVIAVMRGYHATAGRLIDQHEGTLERFTGDGLMVLFNDPVPCPDPAARAVKLAVELRGAVNHLSQDWKKRGHALGFGVGIAHGYATLGCFGFESRLDYTAMGTVVNQAARLCAEAEPGTILVTQRVASAVDGLADFEPLGELSLKGLRQPGMCFRLVGIR